MNRQRRILTASVVFLGGLCATAMLGPAAGGEAAPRHAAPAEAAAASWRNDPAWYDGKAEWAVYEAVRPIYGRERSYEATLFTNKQYMDPQTTTKAADWRAAGNIEVFKHNLSEMIPTENYTYRFLTTCFVRTDTLDTFKLAMSSQEDCGTTYRQFVAKAGSIESEEFCYFPGGGAGRLTYRAPQGLAFHDALSLTLRDYPFDAAEKPTLSMPLVPDQTDTHVTKRRPADATVEYVARETVNVPYGAVETHHLRVTHQADGAAARSEYWFAADASMRHVMVRYEGPYGVRYRLKKLGWWAYWDRSQPRPE